VGFGEEMNDSQWEKMYQEEGDPYDYTHEFIGDLAEKFKERGIKRILDLGSGAGRHLVFLAKEGFEMSGIDSSQTAVKINREKLESEGLEADLKVGDIYEKLPYPDDFFDAIVSIQVIHHSTISNIRVVIKELERILRPGGLIFITVPKSKKTMGFGETKKFNEIEPNTFMPLDGNEKGVPHYYFEEETLREEFSAFKIGEIWLDNGEHFCFIGELK
jgi:ubiquinone/menaquinone biosynthesis C-methylase UbiE